MPGFNNIHTINSHHLIDNISHIGTTGVFDEQVPYDNTMIIPCTYTGAFLRTRGPAPHAHTMHQMS